MNALLIIIVLIQIWFYYTILIPPDLESIDLKNVKFKTGDLILFHSLNNIHPARHGSYFGHVGVVFYYPGENVPYIFEACAKDRAPSFVSGHKSGIIVHDLMRRISRYKGYVAYKQLDKPVSNSSVLDLLDFIKYAQDNMYYNDNFMKNTIEKGIFNEKYHCGTNCGELVTLSLIKMGLLSQQTFHCGKFHHLLSVVKNRELVNNRYLNTVFLKIHEF
jgi:hypothetical protein